MTTARQIITDALTFRLNKLAVGETMDPDTAARCLDGLNSVVDEINGGLYSLWREILTAGTVTGVSATFTAVWPAIHTGDPILGATYALGSMDIPLDPLTMEQYHERISIKSTGGNPRFYAFDGAETVYFWPVPTSAVVTLRTQQMASDFADLDTEYSLPDGWRSGLAAILAELVAPAMLGGVTPAVAKASSAARARLASQSYRPAIINGNRNGGNILTGFR